MHITFFSAERQHFTESLALDEQYFNKDKTENGFSIAYGQVERPKSKNKNQKKTKPKYSKHKQCPKGMEQTDD